MNSKGYILTITTIYYVVIFILFLSLTTMIIYKSSFSDNQKMQSSLLYSKFISSESNIPAPVAATHYWCSEYFYYFPDTANAGYNNIIKKTYCEGYNGKRFV